MSNSFGSDYVFSLHSPPQLIKLLVTQLQIPRDDKLNHNQRNLLGYISDAFPFPYAEAMHGETFQDLMLVSQVCRHSLVAEEKCAVSQCSLCMSVNTAVMSSSCVTRIQYAFKQCNKCCAECFVCIRCCM